MEDASHPCAMATVLLFLIFISIVGTSRKRVVAWGLLFILSILWTNLLLFLGLYDTFLSRPGVIDAMRTIFYVIGCVLLGYGGLNFIDWRRLKRNISQQLLLVSWPILNSKDHEDKSPQHNRRFLSKISSLFIPTCFFVIFAHGLSVLGFFGHQFYHLYVLMFRSAAQGSVATSYVFLGSYGIAFVFPLIVLCISLGWIAGSDPMKKILREKLLYYKIICSAVFLSTGLGLIYFLRTYQI